MTGASDDLPDHYATLQVHPLAEQAVIDAAYRRLMFIYHPDRPAGDADRAAQINVAYEELGDPVRRARYHPRWLSRYGNRSSAPGYIPGNPRTAYAGAPGTAYAGASRRSPTGAPAAAAAAPDEPDGTLRATVIVPPTRAALPGPLAFFGAAYYLLPGPYEWEEGSRRELLTVAMLPVAGLAAFALLTGRLDPWIGHSLNATLLAWGLLVLLFLPMLTSLPRVAMAGGPTLVLLTGAATPVLQQAHLPMWFAWGMASLFSVALAARLFVFGVLPTVAACWLIAQVS